MENMIPLRKQSKKGTARLPQPSARLVGHGKAGQPAWRKAERPMTAAARESAPLRHCAACKMRL